MESTQPLRLHGAEHRGDDAHEKRQADAEDVHTTYRQQEYDRNHEQEVNQLGVHHISLTEEVHFADRCSTWHDHRPRKVTSIYV